MLYSKTALKETPCHNQITPYYYMVLKRYQKEWLESSLIGKYCTASCLLEA